MFFVENLSRNEFFPTELPECFNSDDVADNNATVFEEAEKLNRKFSIPLTYSGYKTETSRRKFAIPNPYHYIKAIKIVVDHSAEIFKIFEKSKYSLTAPIDVKPQKNHPYEKKTETVADTRKEIESRYNSNRYEIRLDINSFFDSVYTHSIPWAIHGIEQAKKRRNDSNLLGNQIDACMRAMNYNQTNGILVGNAVSRIVSEIILCTVDDKINKNFPNISCCRFVDDYYIYVKHPWEIQSVISFIRNELANFELTFNENKIQTNESPFLYGKIWVEQIKQYMHLPPDVFLTKLIIEFRQYEDISILKYGLKIIGLCRFNSKNWAVMQSRLLNIWARFPSLADRIMPIFLKNARFLKKKSIKEAMCGVIKESIALRKDQELVWAVWAIKVFDIKVAQEHYTKILDSENDLAKIIVLDLIQKQGLMNKPKIKQARKKLKEKLESCDVDAEGQNNLLMWTSHWLLAYEADYNKWLTIDGDSFTCARKNQFFKALMDNKIKFYDSEFTYEKSNEYSRNYQYVTRTDLHSVVNQLKNDIIRWLGDKKTEEDMTNIEEDEFYDRLAEIWEKETMIY